MSAEENKALVRRLLERVRGGWGPDVIEEFFAPSYRRYLNPTTPPLTREGQRDRSNRLRAAFPDATVTLEDILAEGDRVAYRLTIRGTHRDAFQGIPPTGKDVTVSFTAIVRIEDRRTRRRACTRNATMASGIFLKDTSFTRSTAPCSKNGSRWKSSGKARDQAEAAPISSSATFKPVLWARSKRRT
jgi:predicted ester cyclase